MKAQEFIRDIGGAAPSPVYLFCPFKAPRARTVTFEPFLAERAAQQFVARYVDPSLKDLCYTAYFADEADPRDIVMTAQTLPFLAERRVLLIHAAEHYESAAAAAPLLSYLDSPSDSTVVLFIASRVDKRSKFYKACERNGVIVECGELREAEVAQWARGEVEALGKRIEMDAVHQLVARTGTRLGDVYNALTLVCSFVGQNEVIHAADVAASCADVAEEEIWALTDAIAASNTADALGALRRILDLGKDPAEIMGTVNWLLKTAYAIAASGPSAVNPFVAKKTGPLAQKLGVGKLRAAFRLCLQTELMLRSTGVDRALALELLVIKLAAPLPRRKTA